MLIVLDLQLAMNAFTSLPCARIVHEEEVLNLVEHKVDSTSKRRSNKKKAGLPISCRRIGSEL